MASFNRVILIGNLTRDPDYKQLSSGQAVCRLSVASNRQFKNKQSGSMVQEVCYIDVDVWGAQAESCKQFLKKGSPVLVEGRIKFDSWQDQQGQTRSKHSIVADRIVFLSSGSSQAEEVSQEVSNPAHELEKELLDQISQIKSRGARKASDVSEKKKTKGATASIPESTGGEIDFSDEPPFQDDLPF